MVISDTPLTQRGAPAWTSKVGGWLRRYLPAELGGTAAALVGIQLALYLDCAVVTVAFIGVWSEVGGFYLTLIVQEWIAVRPLRNCHPCAVPRRPWWRTVSEVTAFLGQTLRNLLLEFGAAELVDPLLLRPALLALAMQWIPHVALALVAGKVAADLIFYAMAISAFELRQRLRNTT